MNIIKLTLIAIFSINCLMAADVELILTSPLINENIEYLDISGTNSLGETSPCSKLIAGYSSCSISGEIITIEYPLTLQGTVLGGTLGTLDVTIEPDSSQPFLSTKILDGTIEVTSPLEIIDGRTKSYTVEIKIKIRGSNSFQEPKGKILFSLNALSI